MRARVGYAARITAVAAVLVIGCATAGRSDAGWRETGWTETGWSETGWSETGWSEAGHSAVSAASSPAADTLNGVAADGESDAWAVGTRFLSSHGGVFLTLTEHWDGQNWKVVPSPSPEGIGEQ